MQFQCGRRPKVGKNKIGTSSTTEKVQGERKERGKDTTVLGSSKQNEAMDIFIYREINKNIRVEHKSKIYRICESEEQNVRVWL